MGLKISAVLGLVLILTLGAFKLYYDKCEAEKEALATQLQQAMDNQLLLENTIKDQNTQMEAQLAREKEIPGRIQELSTANAEAQEEMTEIRGKFAKHERLVLFHSVCHAHTLSGIFGICIFYEVEHWEYAVTLSF